MQISLASAVSALGFALSVQAMPAPELQQNQLQARAVSWNSLGCYSDSMTARALSKQIYSGTKNTNANCQTKCANAGYKYAGTEYGSGELLCSVDLLIVRRLTDDHDL
jgi:WSC domain